jgi:hypothetical protein
MIARILIGGCQIELEIYRMPRPIVIHVSSVYFSSNLFVMCNPVEVVSRYLIGRLPSNFRRYFVHVIQGTLVYMS